MRPAIHRDRLDISRRIEAAASEHSSQLAANVALEGIIRSLKQFRPARHLLLPRRQSRFARHPLEVKDARLVRISGEFVFAHADWKIHPGRVEVASRAINQADTQLLKRAPISNQHV